MAIEPLYSLDVACELIPCTRDVLSHILSRRASEFNPPCYHTQREPRKRNGIIVDYEGGQSIRMLTESECLQIRKMIIVPRGKRERPRYGSQRTFHGLAIRTEVSPEVWDILVNG